MTAIATKHVDDIKIGGVPKIVRGQIIPALEAVFGKLTSSPMPAFDTNATATARLKLTKMSISWLSNLSHTIS